MSRTAIETAIELVAAGNAAIESGDREAYARLLERSVHPECEFVALITAVHGESYRGPDGLLRFFDDLVRAFEIEYRDSRLEALGERVVLQRATLVLRGRESGTEVQRELGVVFEVEEAQLRHMRVHASHADAEADAATAAGRAAGDA